MHPLLALALVAAAGIGVTRLPLPRLRRFAPLDAVLAAGALFVLLGALLGPLLETLDAATLRLLSPVAALGIGWIGASMGARLPWRLVRRIRPHEWARGAAFAVIGFGATALAAWLLMRGVPALGDAWRGGGRTVPPVLALGAAAAVVTGGTPARARRLALIGTCVVIGLAALLLAPFRPDGRWAPAAGVARLVAMVAAGGLLGVTFLWLARLRPEAREHRLELAGVMLLGAAAGLAMGGVLAPFLICGLAAAIIASEQRAAALLAAWEPWISAAVLVMAGAMAQIPTAWILAAAVLLEVLRFAARWLAARYGRWPLAPPSAPGAVGIALSFELVYGGSGAILATALLGVLLAQAVAGMVAAAAARPRPLTAAPSGAEVT